jgi:FkbH-like protein
MTAIPLPPAVASAGLDYLQLVKEAKDLGAADATKALRIAILADFATQQLVPLLKALCARRGFRLEIYEAGYDTIDLEILNRESGLYAFAPDFIAVLMATQSLLPRLYATDARSDFAGETVTRLVGRWSLLRERSSATILQSTFVLPSERAFGGYELKVAESAGSVLAAINQGLVEAARRAKDVLLCDADFIAAGIGRANWFDDRLWSMAKSYCGLDQMPRFAKAVTDTVLAAKGVAIKCVVLDLDNTLWGGVIGDDGLEGIQLGDSDEGECYVALQRFLLELKRRGIILVVVSKNEHANAVLPFREHPNMVLKETDIAVFIANWDTKADNIRLAQKALNIGFDSMVFLDDNPFERNLVRELLPDVIVPELPDDPSLYLRTIADANLFEAASFSDLDRQRADMYREESQRELTKIAFTDVGEYLASLGMTIKLERFSAFNLPRIAQLIQRSNQFNLTTRRYSEAVCAKLMNDPACVPFTLTLADKFGDYGLISVIVLRLGDREVAIDEYLMSCRVLQRGVEQFAMNSIVEFAKRRGATQVAGSYIRTPKNDMVKEFFSGFGFDKVSEQVNGDSEWRLIVDTYTSIPTHITPTVVEL